MSLPKVLWICVGIATVILATRSGIPWELTVVLCFVTAVVTVRLVASGSELSFARVAIGALTMCAVAGIFLPLVLPLAYVGYVAWTWFSIVGDCEGE